MEQDYKVKIQKALLFFSKGKYEKKDIAYYSTIFTCTLSFNNSVDMKYKIQISELNEQLYTAIFDKFYNFIDNRLEHLLEQTNIQNSS